MIVLVMSMYNYNSFPENDHGETECSHKHFKTIYNSAWEIIVYYPVYLEKLELHSLLSSCVSQCTSGLAVDVVTSAGVQWWGSGLFHLYTFKA